MREGGPRYVADALAEFLADTAIRRSPATVLTYRSLLKFPDALPLSELDRPFCRAWVAERVQTKKPASALTAYGALAAFCSWLVREGYVAVSPMQGVSCPRRPEPRTKALGPEALGRLWRAACELDGMVAGAEDVAVTLCASDQRGLATLPEAFSGQIPAAPSDRSGVYTLRPSPDSTTYRLLFLLLRDTGMRRAEVAGARYDDIERDVLTVRGKGQPRRGPHMRRVLLTPEVLGLLGRAPRAAVEANSALVRASPGSDSWKSARVNKSGSIFGVSPSRIGQLFAHIARRAGVKATCHSLRHSYFTDFVARGGSISHAVTLGGWSSDRQLVSRYAKSAMEEAALMEARRLRDTNAAP